MHRFRTVLSVVALVMSLVFALGCADTRRIVAPEVRVLGARLDDETDIGARVLVDVELTHDNKWPLPLVRSSYDGTIPGIGGYSGTDFPNRTLPSKGRQIVTLPLVYETPVAVTDQEMVISGSISYEPPGEFRRILFESGIPWPSASFSARVPIRPLGTPAPSVAAPVDLANELPVPPGQVIPPGPDNLPGADSPPPPLPAGGVIDPAPATE